MLHDESDEMAWTKTGKVILLLREVFLCHAQTSNVLSKTYTFPLGFF